MIISNFPNESKKVRLRVLASLLLLAINNSAEASQPTFAGLCYVQLSNPATLRKQIALETRIGTNYDTELIYSPDAAAKFSNLTGYEQVFPDLRLTSGIAHFVEFANGKVALFPCPVKYVPNKAGHLKLNQAMADVLNRQGSAINRTGSDILGRFVRKQPTQIPGDPVIRRLDWCHSLSGRVSAGGWDDRVLHVPLQYVGKHLGPALRHDQYFALDMDSIPIRHRKAIVELVRRPLLRTLRQSDNEQDVQHTLRQLIGDQYLRTIDAVFFDVTSARAHYNVPENGKPFQAGVSIEAAKDSALNKFFRELAMGRSELACEEAGRIGSIHVCCGIPKSVRVLLNAYVAAELSSADAKLRDFIGEAIDRGTLDLRGIADSTPSGSLWISGGIRTAQIKATPVLPIEKLESMINGLDPIVNWRMQVSPSEDVIRSFLTASSENELEFAAVDPGTEVKQIGPRKCELVRVRLDLSRFAGMSEKSTSIRLLQKIESAFEHILLRRSLPNRSIPESPARSFVDHLTPNGDWKLNAAVTINGRTLSAKLEIGHDLYGFLLAHRLESTRRAQKLESSLPVQLDAAQLEKILQRLKEKKQK